ncbi:hypothetical protein [Actinomyces provencensis]|uniref:hypothetical protein n=1 Tax=Actinomyces provencensis TaxID=1720198 RepID=UPI00096AA5E8|nr:hypothetical protein [Actinomyces provencensis]
MRTGKVTGTFAHGYAAGGVPVPHTDLTVTFIAPVGEFPADMDLVVPDRVVCHLDARGRIADPTDPTGQRLGVELAASEAVPGGFSYQVEITGPSIDRITTHVTVHADQVVDLTRRQEGATA